MKSTKHGKRYRKELEAVDLEKLYSLEDAVGIVKTFNTLKFDQTVELHVKLGLDTRKADQALRGAFALPKGTGRTRKVIVFVDGDEATDAEEAGADFVGSADLVEKIKDGWMDFDVAIAHPRMMKHVGKLGKILGPQGKMPTPKGGTVTGDIKNAVKEFKAGKIEYRTDASGNVQVPVGKVSFSDEDLKANISSFMEHVEQVKPAGAKGVYIQHVTLTATMSPGLALAFAQA